MTPGLPTDLLKTFIVLVRTKGDSRTGEVIGRSQSAMSLQMRRLQEIAGSALFTDAGKRMELSEQGRILHNYAQKIMRLSDECLARLQGEFVVDTIRISIPSDFTITYLPRILGRFVDANPDIALDVRCDLSGDLIQRIKDQAYDAVLCLYDGEPHRLISMYRLTSRGDADWDGVNSVRRPARSSALAGSLQTLRLVNRFGAP
jgi:DNA-binding transcriptional LysR family regulator